MKKTILAVFLGAVGAVGNASTVVISEANGTVEVYLQNNNQIASTYTSPMTSTTVGNNIALRWGTFTGGFTPTTANASSWFSNFVGVNGYVTVGGTSLGKLSASITGGDLQAISSPVNGNSGVGTSATLPQNAQLYAIIWNAAYVANGSGGNTFYPTTDGSNGLQAAVLTNASWIMPLTGGTDPTATNYSLSAGTSAVIGALDLINKGVTLAVIPEPSSLSLVGVGLFGLLAAKRKKFFSKG